VPVTSLATRNPERVEFEVEHLLSSGEKRIVTESVPGWIRPHASGSTPMYEMLSVVNTLVDEWCHRPENADSFPPIVFHITDGECNDATDADLINIAKSICSTKTEEGNTLLINIHLSPYDELPSEIFPTEISATNLSPHYRTLFEMSSTIPEQLNALVASISKPASCGSRYRAMAYNASPCELLTILNIGSESINLA
jgi:hypothetical protein